MTALHVAAATGNIGIVNLLLSREAEASTKDVYGQTALHVATSSNAACVVVLLLQDAADADMKRAQSQDSWSMEAEPGCIPVGWSGLHGAASFGFATAAEYLMCAKADTAARTHDGLTALDLACQGKNVEMIQHLLHNGADPEAELPCSSHEGLNAGKLFKRSRMLALPRDSDVDSLRRPGFICFFVAWYQRRP